MPSWTTTLRLALAALVCASALTGCPAPPPAAKGPSEPDMTVDEPQQCAKGDDESGTCTPDGCVNPPEPEEGAGGTGAQEEVDCSQWDEG